ncbi:hypothetical protein [Nocardioides piscis]|uniref:Uncharacterized protein n=1 Tax=Nocardioides piscis TaxID=2714938 RepID=A0A6G7YBK7_9ACTN|nr:hypothetical protein [Nocardioides piscis]QIK74109.1 hypothetical protein G7071_00305 [Nocardioides piscis]
MARPDLRALERLVVGRARTEALRDGPWCVDVFWTMEVAPLLGVLIPAGEWRELADGYLRRTVETYAGCRSCGFQHSTAWAEEAPG